jgi:hypothetical protein
MFTKFHAHKRCGTLRKILNSTRGYAEITYKGRFFTIKKAYEKFLYRKSKQRAYALVSFHTHRTFYFWETLKSKFWWYFKVLQANSLWANYDKFWQFWAESTTLALCESMPEVRLKYLEPSNSWTMNPNITWSNSLESYHPYLQPQKVLKNPQTYCIHITLPKNTKSHFGCLSPIGVNILTWL